MQPVRLSKGRGPDEDDGFFDATDPLVFDSTVESQAAEVDGGKVDELQGFWRESEYLKTIDGRRK